MHAVHLSTGHRGSLFRNELAEKKYPNLWWLLGSSVVEIGSLQGCDEQVSRGDDSNSSASVYASG
jgi:hypothetical protein